MKTKHLFAFLWIGAAWLGFSALFLSPTLGTAAESDFSKPVIDIGFVVKDAQRTADFLTNIVGLKEVRGFSVNADLGRKIGLIDGYPVDVRVFAIDETDRSARIKILFFPEAKTKPADQQFIHSTLGIRYLTLYVNDISRPLEKAKAAGVRPLGQTPVELGSGTWLLALQDPDGNFIELIGPRR